MHLLTVASVFLLFASTTLAASCSSFAQSGQAYTQPSIRTQIISKGLLCNSTASDCRVPIGGYVTDERTLNITVDSPDSIFELISDTVNIAFNETAVTTRVGDTGPNGVPQTWPVQNGTAGYVGFTANQRCVSGVLSGCEDAPLNNTAVEACTPILGVGDQLSGTIATITSDSVGLTCNPANTTKAKNGNNSNSCTGTEDQTGMGVADGLKGGSLVLLLSALFVAIIGI
ncbi:hypothetical protein AUEXF2481DRAFT_6964 [Aureobasidium subglaciale EXF-2481]|uniref:Uncharacterized protein n=1 Tax=Aureobasidium subglaciale (strain EXF-2481) TaxID=1043005 RepID=A0A074Y5J6_AURSE|nr:uncharacterized protein AUEXF2481DRAFT_6964 [Aureobasidium subglaciale EXF-2481]KAI5195651.1 hypothetical protein E4T38_08971 [Aureobasidium subglaciale]KAI5214630.1 hypothetical protein E4T40_08883 [Aureobasidium subglaciale]KAI5217394.1 hypothetical protein E4T41_08842 [Aureobasidium subglaciale]KAI5255053.1 hypothetical protein E4T46_08876 [Aureobasidium subglaciale]KEQ93000.1 hypothetical protein AUEXF2481DRAFT_6964 [Aureobasidium subglaciale EXF-2481]